MPISTYDGVSDEPVNASAPQRLRGLQPAARVVGRNDDRRASLPASHTLPRTPQVRPTLTSGPPRPGSETTMENRAADDRRRRWRVVRRAVERTR